LETTPVESISVDNCGVVSIYIKAIIDDLSMWRRSVFVDQSAEDIHYLDKTLLSSIAQLQITLSQGEGAMTDEIEFF
jgi:two-component system chemotaxis response regulator CheY